MMTTGHALGEICADLITVQRRTELVREGHEDRDGHLRYHATLATADQREMVHARRLRRDQFNTTQRGGGASERVGSGAYP